MIIMYLIMYPHNYGSGFNIWEEMDDYCYGLSCASGDNYKAGSAWLDYLGVGKKNL